MNSLTQHIERKTDTKHCEDCGNYFNPKDGRPWKYEKAVWLCTDCEDQRMNEEE